MTWRGDGQFVAVSAVCPETGMVPNSTEISTCLKGFFSGSETRQELASVCGLLAT